MAIFAKTKTWLIAPNLAVATSGTYLTDCKQLMFQIVSAMLAFTPDGGATYIWSVKRSSNSVTVADSNLWAAYTNLVWAAYGSARSWIVLHNNVTGLEILIDLSNSQWNTSQYCQMNFSPSGSYDILTGTTTTAPTAADATIWNGSNITGSGIGGYTWINRTTAFSSKTQVWQSTDGKCFMAVGYIAGTRVLNWIFSTVTEVQNASWTYPTIFWRTSDYTLTWANISSTSGLWQTRFGTQPIGPIVDITIGSTYGMYCTVESIVGNIPVPQMNAGIPNDLAGGYGGSLMGITWSKPPAANPGYLVQFRGRQGKIPDIWLGSNVPAEGSFYPAAGSAFVQVGHLIFPWDSVSAYSMT